MELLTIQHQDFEMIVECTKFDDIWSKAKNNIGADSFALYLFLVGGGIFCYPESL